MKKNTALWASLWLWGVSLLGLPTMAQEEQTHSPKPIPQGRAAMLKALEALKYREARLPLAAPSPETDSPSGGLGVVNNGRMRQLYLPPEFQAARSRTPDPNMTLPNDFGVELFWIASRVNNCHYCLGHQEVKLKREGLTEQMLLWLDSDWKQFDPRRQAGFEFARRLTDAPHEISDRDIAALEPHFTPMEILEMAFLVGRYNATNRWTDSLGIPQEQERDFSTALSSSELEKPSVVVGHSTARRPVPPDLATWRQQMQQQKTRSPRLPLRQPTEGGGEDWQPHEALLLNFPVAGKQWLEQWAIATTTSHLPTDLPASLLFVCAIEDGAGYGQQLALKQLQASGWSESEVFALVTADSTSARDQVLQFARKLTRAPQSMTDQDVANLRDHFSPQQIAEIVYRVGLAAHLNRVTQAAGLGWD